MKRLLGRAGLGGVGVLTATLAFAAADVAINPVVVGTPHEAYFAVDFDGATGYVVGAGGAVMKTTDGGVTWVPVKQDKTRLALMDISVEGEHLIATAQLGQILVRRGDGEWKKIETGSPMRLLAVDHNASGKGIVVGQFGTIMVTEDGGASWQPVTPPWDEWSELGFGAQLYDVTLDDSGQITVVGEFGYVLRSHDMGKTWTLAHEGEATLNGMVLEPGGSVGYAVGQVGTVLKTTDGGKSWTKLDLGFKEHITDNLLSVDVLDNGDVIVVGIRSMLIGSNNGSTWQKIKAGDIQTTWYVDVAAAGKGEPPVAVGHTGKIIQVVREPGAA